MGQRRFSIIRAHRTVCLLLLAVMLIIPAACQRQRHYVRQQISAPPMESRPLPQSASPALKQMIEGAIDQTNYTFTYDPAYQTIDYPGGDVSSDRGVCTDVVIRAFRKGGVDLQKEVHEDMLRTFSAYPTKWGLKRPDANIDHRRVPNLQTFFTRQGKALPITDNAADYQPGDVVAWKLSLTGLDHIGVVTNMWSPGAQKYLVVHNIGGGAQIENVLFSWQITGHYRYF